MRSGFQSVFIISSDGHRPPITWLAACLPYDSLGRRRVAVGMRWLHRHSQRCDWASTITNRSIHQSLKIVGRARAWLQGAAGRRHHGGERRRERVDDSRALMQVVITQQMAARSWAESSARDGACLTKPDARAHDSQATAGEHLVRASRGSQVWQGMLVIASPCRLANAIRL